MNKDEYGEIINGAETYLEIADKLKRREAVVIGWTDELDTHYDILFTNGAYKQNGNLLQRGLKGNELFVSIMGKGAFGFDSNTLKERGYIAEKLNLGISETTQKLTDLINGIIAELN